MPRPRFAKLEPDKQAHILAVAAEEFAQSGFDGASYNRIIERAGLSKGAMYYYFDDKTDLYATVIEDALSRMMGTIADGMADDDGEFWARYERMWKHSIEFTLEHPELAALARGLMNTPDHLRVGGVLAKVYEDTRRIAQTMLEDGQAQGAVRKDLPMSLLLSVIFGMGEAVDRWWLDRLDELAEQDLDYWARELIDLFRRVAEPRGEKE